MMPVSEILYKLQGLNLKENTGVRLEGWMNARNTKKQYGNQLRNFSKVCLPKYYRRSVIEFFLKKKKARQHQRYLQADDDRKSKLEIGHGRRRRTSRS